MEVEVLSGSDSRSSRSRVLCTLMLVVFGVFGAGEARSEDLRHIVSSLDSRTPPLVVDEDSPGLKSCGVGLRVVNGCSRLHEDGVERELELSDIRDQLSPLPFTKFTLLEEKTRVVPVGEEAQFRFLGAGKEMHSLAVLPSAVQQEGTGPERVNFVVSWRGPDGDLLLSSRMRVENRKSVVLVSDEKEENGSPRSTVLAIKLSCQ